MKLKRHKNDLRYLVGRKKSLKNKKQTLSQKGRSFLPLLLTIKLTRNFFMHFF
jgi:hypothetical protein